MVNILPVTLARRTWTLGIYVAKGTLALRHTPTVRITLFGKSAAFIIQKGPSLWNRNKPD